MVECASSPVSLVLLQRQTPYSQAPPSTATSTTSCARQVQSPRSLVQSVYRMTSSTVPEPNINTGLSMVCGAVASR